MRLEIKRIGESDGLILPQALLDRLRLQAGDVVVVTETATGFSVTKLNDEVESQLEFARKAMKTHRAAFAALAKR
jgi:putative addiction module antidote